MVIINANPPAPIIIIIIITKTIDSPNLEQALQKRDVQLVNVSRTGKLEGVVGGHRGGVCVLVAGLVLGPVPSAIFY
jgi:hypothetical protein